MNAEQQSRNQKNLTTKTRRREEILCDSSRLRIFVVNRMPALPGGSLRSPRLISFRPAGAEYVTEALQARRKFTCPFNLLDRTGRDGRFVLLLAGGGRNTAEQLSQAVVAVHRRREREGARAAALRDSHHARGRAPRGKGLPPELAVRRLQLGRRHGGGAERDVVAVVPAPAAVAQQPPGTLVGGALRGAGVGGEHGEERHVDAQVVERRGRGDD